MKTFQRNLPADVVREGDVAQAGDLGYAVQALFEGQGAALARVGVRGRSGVVLGGAGNKRSLNNFLTRSEEKCTSGVDNACKQTSNNAASKQQCARVRTREKARGLLPQAAYSSFYLRVHVDYPARPAVAAKHVNRPYKAAIGGAQLARVGVREARVHALRQAQAGARGLLNTLHA